MPRFKCRICGRLTTYCHDLQLCSFCYERERQLEKERKANEKRGFKLSYCKNCGLRLLGKSKDRYDGYCKGCYELLFPKFKETKKLCAYCGREFLASRSDVKHCCKKCYDRAYYRKNQNREPKTNPELTKQCLEETLEGYRKPSRAT